MSRPGEVYLAGASMPRVRPVPAAPSASALSTTVDLFYELSRQETEALRPGERVTAWLPLIVEEATIIVPWSAVVHDAAGGAWVYVVLRPHAFARRRVQVERVEASAAGGDIAALATGPETGAAVVTEGAAELFGIEFGAGK